MKKELYIALVDLYNDYKALADSGDAGNWRLEDMDVGQKALKAIEKYEKYGWKDHDGTDTCPVSGNKRVKVKLRDGEVLFNQAKYFQWLHVDSDRDLIKYKVVKKGK